jgi:hypothetical protein
VIEDLEIIFFCQSILGLFDEPQFLVQKFTVIDDFPTMGTNKMMVMFFSLAGFELITALPITE